jgi:hypothetical protein
MSRAHRRAPVSIALALTLLAGCAGTRQSHTIETSGFLSDYAELTPSVDAGVQLRYVNPKAVFESYESVLLEPVEVWQGPGTADLSAEDSERLATRLYSLMYVRLSRDFRMVQHEGPRTLRLAVALTGAQRSRPMLDTVSTVVPVGLAISTVQELATGKAAFVGEASAEARISDARTGEILFESVDRRVGRKGLSGIVRSWDDVDQAFGYWADNLGYSLCTARHQSNCLAP